MTSTRPRRRLCLATAAVAAALVLASCAKSTPAASTSTGVTLPSDLISQAKTAALADAGGKKIGGSLTVYGVNGGYEGQIVQAVLKPFEDATGITVNYTGTQDLTALVQSRVQAGNPPDVVDDSTAGSMISYAKQGKLVDLGAMIGASTLNSEFDKGLIDATTVNGKIYGVWTEIDNFMVWYNPKNYKGPKAPATWKQLDSWADQQAAAGHTPWCMAENAGAASGFPGTQWILNWFLKTYGPQQMKDWEEGTLAWTSPEVKAAFEAFGAVASNPKMVDGGPTGILAAAITKNGSGLVSTPPRCSYMLWGIYAGGLTLNLEPNLKPVTDLDFFPVPAGNPQWTDDEAFEGHVAYAFKDTPQVQAFMKYWSSVAAQSLFVASGQWTEANKNIPTDTYTDPLLKKAAQTLLTRHLVADPNVTASPAVISAWQKGVVSYIQKPGSLDTILAGIQKAQEGSS